MRIAVRRGVRRQPFANYNEGNRAPKINGLAPVVPAEVGISLVVPDQANVKNGIPVRATCDDLNDHICLPKFWSD